MYRIIRGKVERFAVHYKGPKFHALLCDPPYELGFMGKDWDKSGIAFNPDTWSALAEHLYPGAFGVAFASARGWHRLAVAIEDSGLRIHPSIFLWNFASGFPKSTKIERDSSANLFCRCENFRQQSQQHDYQNNVVDEMDIDVSSQENCSQDSHQCDGQLLLSQDNAQGVLPLQDDALRHNHSDEPLIETQEDNAPLHNLYSVQCNDRQHNDSGQDLQELSGDVSQLSPVSASETYRESDCLQTNRHESNNGADFASTCAGDDKSDYHRLHTRNLDGDSLSGSLDIPSVESFVHDTTNKSICQICGKVKRGVWEGHRYGLQAIKPAVEVLIVFQKPYQGKPVDCIVETGAGALNIDASRVGVGQQWWERDGAPDDEITAMMKEQKGRWPANFCLQHMPECERIGTREVKNESGKASGPTSSVKGGYSTIGDFAGQRGDVPYYADEQGNETIPNWRCVPECPVRRLGLRRVDNSVFLQYNKEKQEVSQCCEDVSIAVVNLMLDHLMSSEGLDVSVAAGVDMIVTRNEERLTHGDSRTSVMGDGIDGGVNQGNGNCIVNLKADGSGKEQMGQYQKDTMYTTLMETSKTTICPICDSCLQLSIMLCTNDNEKITGLSQMAWRQGVVSDAENTNPSQVTLSVQQEHITAIVKIVKESTKESGAKEIQPTTATILGNGEQNNVSRFFFQSDWSHEIAERLEQADPVMYQAKASRSERDAGLKYMPERNGSAPIRPKVKQCQECGSRAVQPGPGAPLVCGHCNFGWVEQIGGHKGKARNPHPTIKPIELCKWLATLLLPPSIYAPRRILVPFAGTGSEMIAAGLVDWEHIIGIELLAENVAIANARLSHWLSQPEQLSLLGDKS